MMSMEMALPTSTELRIYPSFTEIRQQYEASKNFKVYFSKEVFNNIVRGSFSIEGVPIESKQVVPKSNNLENQTIFARRHPKEDARECRVIQADDLLLQDTGTNRYFRAQKHELEYVSIPEEEGVEVSYILKQQGQATLNYQVHGISWSPQYDLNILSDDCQHTFEAFAEISNGTKQEYKVNRTELIGGDIHLQKEVGIKRRRERSVSRNRSMSCSSDDDDDEPYDCYDTAPNIDAIEELAGFYVYSLDKPFTLLPKSTFGLPFINATIRISKCVGLRLPFSSRTQIRKLERKYCIEPIDKFLPGGQLTIREQGHLVGVTTLPDMAVGDKHILGAGQDPDVSLNRQVQLISRERHTATYGVRLIFKNGKSTAVTLEYKELIENDSVQFKIYPKGSDSEKAVIQTIANGMQLDFGNSANSHHGLLPANNGEKTFEYEIRLSFPKKSNLSKRKR